MKLAVVAAAAAAAVATASTAHAIPIGATSSTFSGPAGDHDAQAFWVDVSNQLPGWSAAKDVQLALAVCTKLTDGQSEGHLIGDVANGDTTAISAIRYVVHASEWHYCPEYY